MKPSKNTIFLIEDELDIMFIYKTALTTAKLHVEAFSSGKEAMEKIKEVQAGKREKPKLVLLDLVLPDINGLELLYAIRNNDATKDTAVFILSNYSSDALHDMTAIKADKILVKANISADQLVELVRSQLGLTG